MGQPAVPAAATAESIRERLIQVFAPQALSVVDDSARHAGHAGARRDDGGTGGTHFHVRIVSAGFTGLSRVERQRRVYGALADAFGAGLHALSLTALTPGEARGPAE